MARKAYIGVSTPIAYNHGHKVNKLPNPILEAPCGLVLLYDELWFFDPAMCPENMREMDFVYFVSEYKDTDIYMNQFESRYDIDDLQDDPDLVPFEQWNQIVYEIAPFTKGKFDFHGEDFVSDVKHPIGPKPRTASLYYDHLVASDIDATYIGNSPNNHWMDNKIDQIERDYESIRLVDLIINNEITELQTNRGPDLGLVDSYRKYDLFDEYRSDITTKIDTILKENTISESPVKELQELEEIGEKLQKEANRRSTEALKDKADKSNKYEVIMEYLITLVNPILAPVLASKNFEQERNDERKYGWAYFLTKLEQETKQYKK